jgi:competence protein ComEC
LVTEFKKNIQNATWKLAPFLRLLLPLMVGLLLEYYMPVQSVFLLSLFSLSFILFIFCNSFSFSRIFGVQWMAGIAIQILFFSFGRIGMHVRQDSQVEDSPCYDKSHSNLLLLQILSDPVQKKNTYKCLARISWLIKNQTCYYENEKILICFNKKPYPGQLNEGCWIITRKTPQPIENLKGFNFDYKKYCKLKHIYAQAFLKESDFSILHHEEAKSILSFLDSLRKKLLVIIKKYVPDKSENSLLEALMVGFTDDLDPGLLKSYADTGVVHIIAISGLHLALICQILQIALQKIGRKKSGLWIKLIVIIACLWGYSLLSGASPSVIRAAGMFSLVLFARNLYRETVLYNILAASAFLLLCFDPYWIFDTGFQLSYAAVLSLGLFSKPLRVLLPLQNKILAAIWDAASVSIAAQILTTPISIYYFHRFPTYFLIANLLAVPISSLILVGGILLCICAPIHPLAQLLGWILEFLIRILNGFIEHVSRLPGAVIGELAFPLHQVILVYFIIFCFYCFLILKNKSWLLSGLGAICVFKFFCMIQ